MEKQYIKLTGDVSDDTIIPYFLRVLNDYTKTILEFSRDGGGKEVLLELNIKEIKDVV